MSYHHHTQIPLCLTNDLFQLGAPESRAGIPGQPHDVRCSSSPHRPQVKLPDRPIEEHEISTPARMRFLTKTPTETALQSLPSPASEPAASARPVFSLSQADRIRPSGTRAATNMHKAQQGGHPTGLGSPGLQVGRATITCRSGCGSTSLAARHGWTRPKGGGDRQENPSHVR